jgi:DNA (cytosine-5)-methyltransferase 1
MSKTIKVIELFAGVGGFRLGLEGDEKGRSASSGYRRKLGKDNPFDVVWSNQWEPSTKMQHANLVYESRWPNANHNGNDISIVDLKDIPEHDLLVGGFPCQDYSVATTLKRSGGLLGKKGVLWWQIHRILEGKKSKKPKYLFLENVDRLLKSPVSQRGRDFAVILSSLNSLGYAVEWRVINAAEYGMPQRRRRVFILGYHKSSSLYKRLKKDTTDWLFKSGVVASAFPATPTSTNTKVGEISKDLVEVSETFNVGQKNSAFENSGIMVGGKYWTIKTTPVYKGKRVLLGDILQEDQKIGKEFYIDKTTLKKWEYLKGAKNEMRENKVQGFFYKYNEGSMVFPDSLEKASRTIITGEGGKSASRFKHVVQPNGRMRRLTPVELEALNMFPKNHTKLEGITDAKRAFFMGNALVVGVIEGIGKELAKQHMASLKE